MRMFHFSIEGIADQNKNGVPDVRVRAELLGFKIFDGPVDVSPEKAVKHVVELAKKLGLFS